MPRPKVQYEITGKDKTKQAVNSVKSNFKSLGKTAGKLRGSLGTLFGVGGTLAFAGLIKGSLQAGDNLLKMSAQLGVSVEQLSRFQYAAESANVPINDFNTGMQRMERRLSEVANTGKGEAAPALDRLGLSAKKLQQLKPDQQMLAIAEALSQIKDPAEQVELAFKFFDSGGVKFLRFMKDGAKGMEDMAKKSDELGRTLTEAAAKDMANAEQAVTDLSGSFRGLFNIIAVNVGPSLSSLANWLSKKIPESSKLAGKAINEMQKAFLKGDQAVLKSMIRTKSFLAGITWGKMAEQYNAEVKKLTASLAKTAAELNTLDGLFAFKDQPKFNAGINETAKLTAAATPNVKKFSGALRDYGLAAGESNLKAQKSIKATQITINQFGENTAQALSDSFAQGLFDPLDNSLEGMVASFSSALRRMASEAAAQQIFGALVGLFGGPSPNAPAAGSSTPAPSARPSGGSSKSGGFAKSSGVNIDVQIINNASDSTRVTTGPSDSGNGIKVMIERFEQAIAGSVSRGQGPLSRQLEATYKLNRAGG